MTAICAPESPSVPLGGSCVALDLALTCWFTFYCFIFNSEHVKFHHNQMVPQINSMETKKTKQKQPQKTTMLPCYNVG